VVYLYFTSLRRSPDYLSATVNNKRVGPDGGLAIDPLSGFAVLDVDASNGMTILILAE